MRPRRPLLASVVAAVAAASLALVPAAAAADDGGSVVLPPVSYTASACAGKTPIVVASDAAAQSDLYSAVTLAGVVGTDCVVLAGGRGESWPRHQRARLDAADADGYVVGGRAAVPNSKVTGLNLTRVAGADRWETARLVGNEAGRLAGADDVGAEASVGAEDPITDCTGDIPIVVASDAAAQSDLYSAVTLAGVIGTDCIVLAGDRDGVMLPAQIVRLYTAASGGFVIGGSGAVPNAKVAGQDLTRLDGDNRWHTAQQVGELAHSIASSDDHHQSVNVTRNKEPRFISVIALGGSNRRSETCGLQTNGTALCWGGESDFPATRFPVTASLSDSDFTAIITSISGTPLCSRSGSRIRCLPPKCRIGADNSIECSLNRRVDENVPEGKYSAVEYDGTTACGLRTDDTVVCWGSGAASEAPEGTFMALAVGSGFGCAIRADGTIRCWGRDYDPDKRYVYPRGSAFRFPDGDRSYVSITAGDEHACGLEANGIVTCWGGRVGGRNVPLGNTFSAVSVGHGHACGVYTNGRVQCWGSNVSERGSVPGQADAPSGSFNSVVTGHDHSCGLRADHEVVCWGSNKLYYSVGGIVGQSRPPTGEFTSIAAGSDHNCGLRRDRSIECWGSNYAWSASDDDLDDSHYVGQADPPDGEFIQVDAGVWQSCGLKTDRTILCWGEAPAVSPDVLDGIDLRDSPKGKFTYLSVSGNHACAVSESGSVYCWGDDNSEWLEDESYDINFPNPDPTFRPTPSGAFVEVSVGGVHACGLRADNTIECWGLNAYAGLLDAPQGEYLSVSAGAQFSCAVHVDGHLNCWGGRGL
ncbi:hypothetical protein [Candidatus Poriferisodalis sp.]|uniref:hypothetical protein n=1 Tax=Candidatus Poriferisodalis sp. TaxID=3101277 RepID=UPI003B02A136